MSRSSYQVMISEDQRELLQIALGFCLAMQAFEGNRLDEAEILHTLFLELPADDAGCEDGTLHGFCL